MKITIPDHVLTALDILEQNGYSAYAVGGCVRDSLLGNKPFDWDICTSALPEQTAQCFSSFRVIPTGVKHGTLTVIIESPLEITTFRIDGDYLDNRRPSEVSFTRSIEADLCRRDFTVNAMALDSRGRITDLYGGKDDVKARLIRCVGDAATRFDEDALRIMRALRFASTLDFEIEEKTAAAIHEKKHLLKNIAAERIHKEFTKMLCGDCAEIIREFEDVIKVFMPEADTGKSTTAMISHSPADPMLRLALLFGSTAAQQATDRLHQLKFDNRTISSVNTMLGSAKESICAQRPHLKHLLNRYGKDSLKAVLTYHLYSGRIIAPTYEKAVSTADDIIAKNECFTLSALAVNGSDISALGLFRDSQIGKVLHALLDKVIDGELENEKKSLISAAKNLKY